jgi:hypothetical protein
MEDYMRNTIWRWFVRNVPEGMVLPWWALVIRSVLFPLDFFFWRMSKTRGYQWQTDTWLIEGVTYSAEALRCLSEAQGEIYRVNRIGKTVTLELMPNKMVGATGFEPVTPTV